MSIIHNIILPFDHIHVTYNADDVFAYIDDVQVQIDSLRAEQFLQAQQS